MVAIDIVYLDELHDVTCDVAERLIQMMGRIILLS